MKKNKQKRVSMFSDWRMDYRLEEDQIFSIFRKYDIFNSYEKYRFQEKAIKLKEMGNLIHDIMEVLKSGYRKEIVIYEYLEKAMKTNKSIKNHSDLFKPLIAMGEDHKKNYQEIINILNKECYPERDKREIEKTKSIMKALLLKKKPLKHLTITQMIEDQCLKLFNTIRKYTLKFALDETTIRKMIADLLSEYYNVVYKDHESLRVNFSGEMVRQHIKNAKKRISPK